VAKSNEELTSDPSLVYTKASALLYDTWGLINRLANKEGTTLEEQKALYKFANDCMQASKDLRRFIPKEDPAAVAASRRLREAGWKLTSPGVTRELERYSGPGSGEPLTEAERVAYRRSLGQED
jgi:hypothetical protein